MNDNVVPFDDQATIEREAREWLIRLDRDDPPSKAELSALRQWAAQSRAHHRELMRISAFWDDANVLNELSTPVYNRTSITWRSLLSKIYASCSPATRWAGVAASAALAIILTTDLVPPPIDTSNGLYITAIGEVQEQKLVDGSVLQLNTDSQVQVSYSDGVRKIRLLKGEAHFEVAPNKQWPFQVYAGNGMVKAVGTAFSVRLNPEQIDVVVSEGVVDIASIRPANQTQPHSQQHSSGQAKYTTQTAPATHKIASLKQGQASHISNRPEPSAEPAKTPSIQEISAPELERKLAWRTGYLVFAGDPLSQVIAEISRYTPISIQLASPDMADIRVGGRFKVGEFDAMLEVLESSFGLQVSYLDDQRIQLRLAEQADGSF